MMTDTFRKVYKPLSEAWSDHILSQKEKAEELEELFSVVKSREMYLAMTHLETALMWATKAIALHNEKLT
jgi:hypothetical protein